MGDKKGIQVPHTVDQDQCQYIGTLALYFASFVYLQEIEHYQTKAEANAGQTREEALVFMGGYTQDLILGTEAKVS